MKGSIVPAVLAIALASGARADVVDLVTVADTYVRLGTPVQNYGNTTDIPVKNSGSTTTTRKGYVRFSLSSIDLNAVTSAVFSMEMILNNNGGTPTDPTPFAYTVTVFGLNDADPGESWIEGNGGTDNNPFGEIVWTNAPANILADNSIDTSIAPALGSFVTPAVNPSLTNVPQIVTFSSVALVDFIKADTDGQITLILQRSSSIGNNLGFAAREHATAQPPTLTLGLIPEPSAAGLLAAGLALLLSRARRDAA